MREMPGLTGGEGVEVNVGVGFLQRLDDVHLWDLMLAHHGQREGGRVGGGVEDGVLGHHEGSLVGIGKQVTVVAIHGEARRLNQ